MQVVSDKAVSLGEARETMEKRKKDSELGYEQSNTLAYLEKFSKLSPDKAEKLRLELNELNVFSEKQIAQLIDILPQKENIARAILFREKQSFTEEQVKEAVKIIKKFAG